MFVVQSQPVREQQQAVLQVAGHAAHRPVAVVSLQGLAIRDQRLVVFLQPFENDAGQVAREGAGAVRRFAAVQAPQQHVDLQRLDARLVPVARLQMIERLQDVQLQPLERTRLVARRAFGERKLSRGFADARRLLECHQRLGGFEGRNAAGDVAVHAQQHPLVDVIKHFIARTAVQQLQLRERIGRTALAQRHVHLAQRVAVGGASAEKHARRDDRGAAGCQPMTHSARRLRHGRKLPREMSFLISFWPIHTLRLSAMLISSRSTW
ncbi:MAG TPA: hypothetical protein VF254_04850 [Gammaproteobacteria bacterium]